MAAGAVLQMREGVVVMAHAGPAEHQGMAEAGLVGGAAGLAAEGAAAHGAEQLA